jgi:hypothetical protein
MNNVFLTCVLTPHYFAYLSSSMNTIRAISRHRGTYTKHSLPRKPEYDRIRLVSDEDEDEDIALLTEKFSDATREGWATFSHTSQSFNVSIEGLRGLAVTLTCLAHLLKKPFPNSAIFGDAGVDIFFVLSGFLMTRILLRRQVSTWTLLDVFIELHN